MFLGRATHDVYTGFLKRKLAEWYCNAPKSDIHAPGAEDENDGDAGEEGGCDGEEGARGGSRAATPAT